MKNTELLKIYDIYFTEFASHRFVPYVTPNSMIALIKRNFFYTKISRHDVPKFIRVSEKQNYN